MSAGAFVRARYEASYAAGVIHPIRVQPETLAAVTTTATPVTNTGVVAAATSPISALGSLSNRKKGLKPRMVSLQVAGTPPTGYAAGSRTELIALRIAFYNDCNIGATISFLGTTWIVIGKSPERVS
jgi:hypothetical protein